MSGIMATAKQSLVGSPAEPQHGPQQIRSNFFRHARKDDTGEFYMNEEDFVNAVAPAQEDYVSSQQLSSNQTAV